MPNKKTPDNRTRKKTSHGTGTYTKNGTKHKATQLWATIKWNDATKDDNEWKYNGNVRAREMPNKWKCNIFFRTQKWDILIVRAFMQKKILYFVQHKFSISFFFRFSFSFSFVICVSLHFRCSAVQTKRWADSRCLFDALSSMPTSMYAVPGHGVSSRRPCHARILVKLLWTCYLFTRASTQ